MAQRTNQPDSVSPIVTISAGILIIAIIGIVFAPYRWQIWGVVLVSLVLLIVTLPTTRVLLSVKEILTVVALEVALYLVLLPDITSLATRQLVPILCANVLLFFAMAARQLNMVALRPWFIGGVVLVSLWTVYIEIKPHWQTWQVERQAAELKKQQEAEAARLAAEKAADQERKQREAAEQRNRRLLAKRQQQQQAKAQEELRIKQEAEKVQLQRAARLSLLRESIDQHVHNPGCKKEVVKEDIDKFTVFNLTGGPLKPMIGSLRVSVRKEYPVLIDPIVGKMAYAMGNEIYRDIPQEGTLLITQEKSSRVSMKFWGVRDHRYKYIVYRFTCLDEARKELNTH